MVRPACLVVFALAVLAAKVHAASTLPGRMGMYAQQGGAPLAMLDSKIVVRVRGPVAEAIVTQTFRNDTDRVTEATYIFPLPADAAVTAMEIETGTRTIRAAIEARDQAQQRYEGAIAAGVGAALLDQERPDVFTQAVSAIPARGTVTVTLRYDTVARYQGGRWELVVPLVVAPRYVPGTASGRPTTGSGRAPDTDRAPDASRITPGGAPGAGGATEIVLDFADPVDDVTSPTHDIAKHKATYALRDPKTDHDAVIRWRARLPAQGWVEAADDGGYAAVVVEAPPAAPRKGALRVMLLLDRAATTKGDAEAMQRPLVRALLAALGAKDSVAVGGGASIDWRAPDQVQRALDEVWAKPGGAFDLSAVLARTRSDGAPIVLVADGLVADDRAVLAAAAKLGVPIHVVGIGPAPNRSLLAAIAAATGGTVRFATIGDDVAALARDVLADAASPPEPLSITWGTLAAIEVVPATLPRLGAGQATLVLAKVRRAQAANARVRGDVFGFVAVRPGKPPDGATTPRGSLARRWARQKLDDLIAAGDARAITEHALAHGLVSPYTSMVAVGEQVIVKGGVKHSVPIAVSVPEGMRWQLVQREIAIDARRPEAAKQDRDRDRPKTNISDTKRPAPTKKRPPREVVPEPVPAPAPRTFETAQGAPATDAEQDNGAARVRTESIDAAPTAPSVAAGSSYDASFDDEGEYLARAESAPHRRARLSLALGGGLSITGGELAPLAGLSARVELGRRVLGGAEATLWLVDGLNAQGTVLGTVALRGVARRFELRGGAGLSFTGDAAGPAWSLTLRARLPIRPLATFLRYDGALLLREAGRDVQSGASVGVEAAF